MAPRLRRIGGLKAVQPSSHPARGRASVVRAQAGDRAARAVVSAGHVEHVATEPALPAGGDRASSNSAAAPIPSHDASDHPVTNPLAPVEAGQRVAAEKKN